MAFIELDREKLHHNYQFLKRTFDKNNIEFGIVTKLLCGHNAYLKEVINLGVGQVCDSRISNLKKIKNIDSEVETVYIKPPAKRSIKSIVAYADISLNTESYTIKLLSEEAQRQDKVHKIIIMIEMGDLREGVMREDFIDFYEKVFEMPNIEVVGIGTNLSCMSGVMPSPDKLIQLSLYEQLIEARFSRNVPYVSGGTSVTLPMLLQGMLPPGINHYRLGETLYLGNNLINDKPIKGMKQNALTLYAELIELTEKPIVPEGDLGENVDGQKAEIDPKDVGKTAYRGLLDIGLLDIDPRHIEPFDADVEIAGASSDMIVIDLGSDQPRYKVGDLIRLRMTYMGALGVMNSNYIEKRIV
ncbi:MAG TPA: alanine/ornithine racemase family PLP-dependent enzyme [Salinivirga sp.]|uniref:alanine/ornithine racemase family PLP-dependent enzyme n=1 Tax=Salinivirga sp. TaxID=1970192 RepID=UPI002B4A452B|nr:alanine/ornithine racemase family PLP-dependent enzyme [Salinivirga sp.]HKK59960.1 alanine/ornithine racemase family PLP-dependent enzyme [Salinivirga sp.]